ncbi:MAG: transcriptional regulator [Proteobacteria bacterium]|nr:transcriptional regulator [Pseudomonadota bacterium]MBU1965669.1 transcriptional regulator [Pseudomonadota bacterium]MBU4372168.1 transcriptional regulator [Pseudomonadota bacterium]MBU4582679.1 transcriptional regulator [Pseudomonadota bacterium]
MAEKIIIKKYGNRRLYDTENNTYVTLTQVADIIKSGRTVEVVDAKTKEVVTAFTLTQIVLEEARKKNFLLPVPLLHLMIQFGETILSEFFEKYLQQVIRNYLAYKESVDQNFEKWLGLSSSFAEQAKESMGSVSAFQTVFDLFADQSNEIKKTKGA